MWKMARNVKDVLVESIRTFEEKGREYRHSYLDFGKVILDLFPGGIEIKNIDDANTFGIFFMIVHKIMRISSTGFKSVDSIEDLIVYSAMLRTLFEKKSK
jgi:hypothetical protein